VAIRCTGCGFPLSNDVLEGCNAAREFRACRFCGSETMALVFPAMFTSPSVPTAAEMAVGIGDATCFYHASKRASTPCSQCGRFLCKLCSVEFSGGVWCPECIEAGRTRKRVVNLENQRTLYDSIALGLSTWPILLFFYPTMVTAPAALVCSMVYWKRPSSIVRRHPKFRLVLAMILSVAQIIGWIALVIFVIYQFRKGVLQHVPK
jgi:hypothetical protein